MLISTTTASWRDRSDGSYIPIIQSIAKIAAAGFDAVDLNFCHAIKLHIHRDGIEINADDWESWQHRVEEALNSNNIRANQSHAPYYNVLDYTLSDIPFREEMVRRSIIVSGNLGVKWVVIHAGTAPDSSSAKVSLAKNIEYFKPHLELAAKHGTGIAIENLFDFSSDDKSRGARRYTGGIDELFELVDALAAQFPNVGICWDFGHANEMALKHADALRLAGKRLKALHVNDNNGVLDDHSLPFTGAVKWPELMKTLHEIGYEGDFTYEIHKYSQHMPDEIIDDALRLSAKLARYLVSLAA